MEVSLSLLYYAPKFSYYAFLEFPNFIAYIMLVFMLSGLHYADNLFIFNCIFLQIIFMNEQQLHCKNFKRLCQNLSVYLYVSVYMYLSTRVPNSP